MLPPVNTKARLLQVAEELFAEQGLDRVSIRDITDVARENVAAINYHFGGKDELIAAVFERRVGPVNRARLAELERLEKMTGSKPAKVEDIVAAFIRPAVVCCQEDEKGSKVFARLFGRCLSETRPEVEILLRKQFQPVVKRMEEMLLRSMPHLSSADIFWRLKFTFGALHHWLLTRDKSVPDSAAGTGLEEQMQKLISFATAGFKAK
jgi:AcrR family transcriptional regulator